MKARWFLLCGLVLLLIIGPFLLFGETIEAWTAEFLKGAQGHRPVIALVLGGLLASDIVLPIPSSVVSTGCGAFLGFVVGTLVSCAGMIVSCVAGFGLGTAARPLARRMMGEREMLRLEHLYQRFGDWTIVITRPVPVLAEATVLFAGTGKLPFGRFVLLSSLANVCISAVYAAVGSFAANVNAFLLAVAASLLVPGLAILLLRKAR